MKCRNVDTLMVNYEDAERRTDTDRWSCFAKEVVKT